MENILTTFSQLSVSGFLITTLLVLFALLGIFVFLFVHKSEQVKELTSAHNKLIRSFNELDEQAKLIVKTDLELNKAQEELDRRLSGLNTLQKTTHEISMTLDANEIFQKLNEELFNELGFSKALVLSVDENKKLTAKVNVGFPEAKLSHPLYYLEHDEDFQTAFKDGQTFSSSTSIQKMKNKVSQLFEMDHYILTPIRTQNGTIGIILVGNRYSSSSVTDGDEELIGILASQIGQALENAQLFEQVFRSSQILESKVKDRTKQLELALTKVRQISKTKSEFISAVSHELRTPLTSIKGYAALLMTGKVGSIPDAVKDRLAKINTHSDNLVNLINNLLDISRIESGRVEMKVTPQPARPVVDNMADLLAPQMKDKGVQMIVTIPDNCPDIFIDETQVERVFINLVSNAIKFTPSGGSITVTADPQPEKELVIFSVTDTGIGIKEDDLEKLFDEFYRVDNQINLSVKGTGLGLALAKNIVEAHSGRMWVKSTVDVGTTFYFTLPTTERKLKSGAHKVED